jgi:hypothetical protein
MGWSGKTTEARRRPESTGSNEVWQNNRVIDRFCHPENLATELHRRNTENSVEIRGHIPMGYYPVNL